MTSFPSLSVVIPTHNRSALLRRTLGALAVQSYPMVNAEVVVVADGCTDDTLQVLRDLSLPFALQVVEESGRGAAAARNAGAAAARGDLLLFIDDDVEPTPTLVMAHLQAHEAQPGGIVLGPYPPVIAPNSDLFRMELRTWWQDHFRDVRRPDHRFTYRDVCTGNLSLDAALFKQMGGFDPAFPNAGGEDYEFGIRLIKAGVTFHLASQAMACHYDNSDLDRTMKRTRQEGRSDVLIGRRHPEMRPHLPLANFEDHRRSLAGALRNLAFVSPTNGDMLAGQLRRTLNLYERLRLRGPWYKTYQVLHGYWYWRGVADEIKSTKALAAFIQGGVTSAGEPHYEIEIDLCLGLQEAEERLDRERPSGLRIRVGEQSVGHILPRPGSERLRGAHLRPLLANELALPLMKALAMNGALGKLSLPAARMQADAPVYARPEITEPFATDAV